MLDLVREIGQTLRNNRLRTVLTGISVSWGIFMLIVLLGASRGVTNYFEYAMSSQSNNDKLLERCHLNALQRIQGRPVYRS